MQTECCRIKHPNRKRVVSMVPAALEPVGARQEDVHVCGTAACGATDVRIPP